MAEPRVVVGHREHLWALLAEAAQLEHMIMCQYLYAEFSLAGAEDGLTPEQVATVQRWRKVLHGIAVEEMLHLALVANLMSAIGAAPQIGRPNFPQRSGYFPRGLMLDLVPFGEQALRHFLYLERPEGLERHDAAGFVPTAPPRTPVDADDLLPQGQEFLTVGHLYRGIRDGLVTLTERLGEQEVFVGLPRAQATPELLQWPQVVAVTDLASAEAAIDEIIEQGEGARGDWQDAHYGRFLGIWDEFQALSTQASFTAARPVTPAYTRQPFDIAEPQVLITDPLSRQLAELCGVGYEMVMQLLVRFFTHTNETDEQLGVLMDSAIGLMAGVVAPLAGALSRLPVGPEQPGRTVGFPFEVYYTMGNMVPWRVPAWKLLHERMGLLAEHCRAESDQPFVQAAVEQARTQSAKVTAALAAHLTGE